MKTLLVFLIAVTLAAEVFETARMDGVYRMRLDKDALVLESILEFLQKERDRGRRCADSRGIGGGVHGSRREQQDAPLHRSDGVRQLNGIVPR